MNTLIKKFSILALASMALLLVSSCSNDKDDKNDNIPSSYAIKGTVFTKQTIKDINTLQAIIEKGNDKKEIIGSTHIKNKKFTLSLKTPTHLNNVSTEELPSDVSISNPNAKVATLGSFQLLNSGTMSPEMGGIDMLICSKDKPKIDVQSEDLLSSSIVMYMYSDSDLKAKGHTVSEDVGKMNINLNLKKGWNIVLLNTNGSDAEFQKEMVSTSTFPEEYKWYLLSDLLPDFMPKSKSFSSNTLPWLK